MNDSAVTPSTVASKVVVPDEQEDGNDSYTPEAARYPNRASNESTPAGVSGNDYEEDEKLLNPPPPKSKEKKHPSLLGFPYVKNNPSEESSHL